ncbi:hypothetical protein EV363DRAFT_1222071, partial [Boletus edulis]
RVPSEEVEKKYNLITRRLREVLGVIKGILARKGRSPKAYWEPLQPDTTCSLSFELFCQKLVIL